MRECISECGPLVWSIARRFAPSTGDAEDAVQEIFLELWKHAGRYDPALSSEQAFITMLARRRMIERLRRAERRPQLRPAPDSFTGVDGSIAERCPEVTIAAGVLATLDPRQRRVLSLAIGQGMTHAELAEATSMPLDKVKSLVRRALVAVRKRLLARGGATVSDAGKRVHTLLTDGAVAGLTDAEREELEVLLGGAPLDPSYERAAAAIELSLLDHSEELPIELEAAIVQQAGRYWGFTALRPREPTLGADADATPVRRIWERSPDNIDELAVLESSLTNGRLDRGGSGEILISTDEPSGEHHEAERAQQFDSEVDAQLEALEQPSKADLDQEEDEDELEDDDEDDLEDDDDEDEDEQREVAQPTPAPARPRPRKRPPSKPGKQARAPEESQQLPTRGDNRMLRWATYVSALAALAMLVVALWLFATRDASPDPDDLAAEIAASDDAIEWSFVAKPDKAVGEGAGGTIVWSSKRQSGVMTVRGLAANDPTVEQYQLWIVDRGREGPPVDGGVFDVPAGADELRLPVDAKLLIGDPAAFVITVERPGGVVVSRQDRVAMVAAPG